MLLRFGQTAEGDGMGSCNVPIITIENATQSHRGHRRTRRRSTPSHVSEV